MLVVTAEQLLCPTESMLVYVTHSQVHLTSWLLDVAAPDISVQVLQERSLMEMVEATKSTVTTRQLLKICLERRS